MDLLAVTLVSAALLLGAYLTYGSLLRRLFRLDARIKTPAVAMKDDVDYAPIAPRYLFGQHFSAIAAAGPITGPILAATTFGWLPANGGKPSQRVLVSHTEPSINGKLPGYCAACVV